MLHPIPGALLLATLATLANGQDTETLTESWPDGSPKVEHEVIRDEAGEAVDHGDYRSWHENGQKEAEGRCKNGLKVDTWRTWHPNGQLASKGVYRRGLRTQKWTYLDENGGRDGGESGEYKAEFNTYPDGTPESQGEYRFKSKHGDWIFFHPDGSVREKGRFKLGKRSGRWVSYWPDGKKLFEGTYVRGDKEGDWTFFHANGYPDPAFLSGVYAKGERAGPLEQQEPLDPDAPWFDLDALADPAPYPLTGGDRKHLDDLFARFLMGGETVREAAQVELVEWGYVALPLVLKHLKGLDVTRQKQELVGYRLHHVILHELLGGHSFEWKSGTAPADVAHNRLTILRWLTLWRLKGGDASYWETLAATDAAAKPDLLFQPPLSADAFAAAPPPADENGTDMLVTPAEDLWRRERGRLIRDHGGRGTEEAVASALEWLAAAQTPLGYWDADNWHTRFEDVDLDVCHGAGNPLYDVGVTGLAVLAFVGAGNSTTEGEHSNVVEKAVQFLLGQQDQTSGMIGSARGHDYVYGHAIGTMALIEAGRVSPSPLLHGRLQKAVDFILLGQNPGFGWRYGMPPREQDNDTSVTSWMVTALSMAKENGYRVGPAAFEGALRWLDQASETTSGRVGYDSAGSLSARVPPQNGMFPSDVGEPMTAAALFCRILMGETPGKQPIMKRHAALVLDKLPEWEPEQNANDMYYWYYGTYAMFQWGGDAWEKWNAAMKAAVVDSQRRDGACEGSWDPMGPWGFAGGRVYSTALMALTLEVYYRHPQYLR